MNIALTITINSFFRLLIAINLSLFLSLSYASDSENAPERAEQDTMQSARNMVHFQVSSESEQDQALVNILEEANTFNRIQKLISTNFMLTLPIRFHIQHAKESSFIATEIEQKSHIVNLPFSFLHTLYQGLSNKYEHQSETINAIFSTSLEYYIWSEFAEYLILNKQLEVQGDSFAATDNFASIMLLNQNIPSSDYMVDASEAYLLIHRTKTPRLKLHGQNELQLDQQRYKHIICLSIGFDQTTNDTGREQLHLNSFAWDEAKIDQCKNSYTLIMRNWHQAITKSLHKTSIIHHWLNPL